MPEVGNKTFMLNIRETTIKTMNKSRLFHNGSPKVAIRREGRQPAATANNNANKGRQEKRLQETLLSLKFTRILSARSPVSESLCSQRNNADKYYRVDETNEKEYSPRLKSNKRKRDYPRSNCSQLV